MFYTTSPGMYQTEKLNRLDKCWSNFNEVLLQDHFDSGLEWGWRRASLMSKQVMTALPIQASIYWLGFSKWLLPFFFFSVTSLPPSFLPFLCFSFSFQFGSVPEINNFIVTSYRECYHYVEPWNPSTNTKTKLTFLLQTEKEWLDR